MNINKFLNDREALLEQLREVLDFQKKVLDRIKENYDGSSDSMTLGQLGKCARTIESAANTSLALSTASKQEQEMMIEAQKQTITYLVKVAMSKLIQEKELDIATAKKLVLLIDGVENEDTGQNT